MLAMKMKEERESVLIFNGPYGEVRVIGKKDALELFVNDMSSIVKKMKENEKGV